MTPAASHLSANLDNGSIGNFFYPTLPNLLDRIYIGISVPLFASNWGASFLLELLKIIKPGGVVILPVYPEGQAQEKGYWSRSFLENIFLSRQRWTGFSNVRAENDGVMSLGIGRKLPDPIPSTAQWFYQQRAHFALEKLLQSGDRDEFSKSYAEVSLRVWANNMHSSVIERIILDFFGAKQPVTVNCVSNDYGLLVTDLLLSNYINVIKGSTIHVAAVDEVVSQNFTSYFKPHTGEQHTMRFMALDNIQFESSADVINLIHCLANLNEEQQTSLIDKAWNNLKPNGLLVLHDAMPAGWQQNNLHQKLSAIGKLSTYSSIVASKIEANVKISHYSTLQEEKLREEKLQQTNVFKVIQKK